MGCLQVRYDSRVVIYERKLFIRLATGVGITLVEILNPALRSCCRAKVLSLPNRSLFLYTYSYL